MPRRNGFTLLEVLFSLSISLFLVSLMVKLYGLQETLHRDVQALSTLNRHAIMTRQIIVRAIENSQENFLYLAKNNLYIKKPDDIAVELMPGVKNFRLINREASIEINATVFVQEKNHETQGLYPYHSINLHFFVKPHRIINTGYMRD